MVELLSTWCEAAREQTFKASKVSLWPPCGFLSCTTDTTTVTVTASVRLHDAMLGGGGLVVLDAYHKLVVLEAVNS
jgi:hypothetical protein